VKLSGSRPSTVRLRPRTKPSADPAGKVILTSGRMLPMADIPERQGRQQDFVPTTPNRILSDEAMEYVTSAANLQREAMTDPYLNGEDSRGRVKL
jgi:hypothetical protein